MLLDVWSTVGIAGASLGAAAVVLSKRSYSAPKATARAIVKESERETVFVFDDEKLLDATRSAKNMLNQCTKLSTEWITLLAYLAPSFPNLINEAKGLAQTGKIELVSRIDPSVRVSLEHWYGLARVQLHNNPTETTQSAQSHDRELSLLRETVKSAPYMVWQETEDGQVIWANKVYLDTLDAPEDEALTWPLPPVFETLSLRQDLQSKTLKRRLSLIGSGPSWFDVTRTKYDGSLLFFACPADELVKAERSLQEFVQTLSKTFAQLPIGIAIFDHQGTLALFNPELSRLFPIPIDTLIQRPSMHVFFDKLRETRMVPEHRDFSGWRSAFLELDPKTNGGQIHEVWTLPDGTTLQVSATAHTGGACALIFQDVSGQVSEVRAARETVKSHIQLLDLIDRGIMLFDDKGRLDFANEAAQNLWNLDASKEWTARDLVKIWRAQAGAKAIWTEISEIPMSTHPCSTWAEIIVDRMNTSMEVSVQTFPDGKFAVSFNLIEDAPIQKLDRLENA